MNDYEGFKTSLEEVSADVVETVREMEWEVELEAVTELLQFHNKTLTDEELLQMSKKVVSWGESCSGEDAVKTTEMTEGI